MHAIARRNAGGVTRAAAACLAAPAASSATAAAVSATSAARRSLHALHRASSTAAPTACLVSPAAAAALRGSSFLRSAAPLHAPRRSAFSYPTSRTLDELVKLPMLIPHTRDEVVHIWQAQHTAKQNNGAALADHLSAAQFALFAARAKRAPLFVVPAFKTAANAPADAEFEQFDTATGFENMLVNVQASSLLLTSLEEYKSRGAGNASPFAVITLYDDLANSHDLVLVRAELMDVNVTAPMLRAMWGLLKRLYAAEGEAPAAASDAAAAAADAGANAGVGAPDSPFERFAAPFNRKPAPTIDFDAYVQWAKQTVAELRLPKLQQNTLAEPDGNNTTAATPDTSSAGEVKEAAAFTERQ